MSDRENVARLVAVEEPDPARVELERRLADAKVERARLAAEREKREADRALAEELEREERAIRDEQAIADAEAAHGPLGKKIAAVHTSQGVVIVKRPNAALFRKFTDAGELTSDECERLVRPSLVHPARAVFDKYAEEEPAILVRCANACAKLAGVRKEELTGKS